MKATYIYVVLAMAISSLAATTAVQNNQVQTGNNRFGGFGGRGGQNGQQNRGSNNGNKNNNQNGNANNSNSQKNGSSGAAGSANTGSVRTSNGSNQNQTNSTSTAGSSGSAAGSTSGSGNPQTSLTLDPSVIAQGFANNGQDVPEAGQVASLTSTNNFINFCIGKTITNGKQITGGSCNPAPMGNIPSTDNMPSAKFVSPKNGDTLQENTAFTVTMAIQNMQTGAFVNAQENYFAAPQQLNSQGQIVGHSHVVIESLTSLDQTAPTDPRKFAFFKGLNAAASGGVLTADVTAGLPAGTYRLASINTAANHQPVLVPIAQHGSLDDAVYFTVSANGAASSNSTASTGTGSSSNTGAATGSGSASSGSAGNTGAATGSGSANSGSTSNTGAATGSGSANSGTASNTGSNKGSQSSNQSSNQNQNQGGNKAQNGQQRNSNGRNSNQNNNQGQGQRNGGRFGRRYL